MIRHTVVFTFPPVTAKYLKVALQTDWGGGYIAADDFKLFGQLGDAAPASSDAQVATQTGAVESDANLLAQANGGTILTAPNDEWAKLNDGSEDRAVTYDGEGVWQFKDGLPATFDTFEMLIQAQEGYNVKEFELQVGDESPSGSFRLIGTFTTQNIKLMQSPYQAFSFPPVTAKYLKVILKSDWGGGYIAAYEFRVKHSAQ